MACKFVAIDFETANEMISSACALGIAMIENNMIVTAKHWLIRPPELRFNRFNSSLHNITSKDVEKKPEFYRIWPSIMKYLKGNIIIAHNASFDIAVLKSILKLYQIDIPELYYACTVSISRKAWNGFENYKLSTIAQNLQISFVHHNAKEDAITCANIAINAADRVCARNMPELIEKLGITIRRLGEF